MMLKFRLFLLILLTLTLAGCGKSPSQRLVGKWKFDAAKAVSNLAKEHKDDGIAAAIGVAQAMGQKMEIILEFNADQTGNATTIGLPSPFAGPITWKTLDAQGDKLTIEITNPKENATSKVQITFVDDDHIQFLPPDAKMKAMEFERVKEK
jgi:outer membrane lipoprotein-sorting protein